MWNCQIVKRMAMDIVSAQGYSQESCRLISKSNGVLYNINSSERKCAIHDLVERSILLFKN